MGVLVLNCGSSSVKFEVFDDDLGRLADGLVEAVGEKIGGRLLFQTPDDEARVVERSFDDHGAALDAVINALTAEGLLDGVDAVGHRMVHGGAVFTEPTLVTDEVEQALADLSDLAPLHNPPALAGVRAARQVLSEVPHVVVFDTAFHMTLEPEAYRYAIPEPWFTEHGVRRYGFHGTSHDIVSRRAAAFLGRDLSELKLITLHLGNGASACAINGGRSIDTSMGLTPLEGLVMGTRSGDLDPAVPFHLLRAGLNADDIEDALNRSSGLRGLADENDVRALLEREDDRAVLALALMARRLRGYIGAYLAHLGGLDAVVFTAGIGEHAAPVRAAVIEPLAHLGLRLDRAANESANAGEGPVRISPAEVSPAVLVVATDEELRIAEQTVSRVG